MATFNWILSLCLWLLSTQRCVCMMDRWSNLSKGISANVRTQRDVMRDTPIDQVPLVGVDLSTTVFTPGTNHSTALSVLENMLLGGVQTFLVDLDYDYDNNKWQIVNTTVLLQELMDTFQRYIERTNNSVMVNMLVLLLRVSSNPAQATKERGDSSNTAVLEMGKLEKYMYSISDLAEYNEVDAGQVFQLPGGYEWPSLTDFFFYNKKRLVVVSLDDNFNHNSNKIFGSSILHLVTDNSTIECPLPNADMIHKQAELQWKFLHSNYQPEHIHEYISCGYSPIIANHYNSTNLDDIIPLIESGSRFFWGPDEPRMKQKDKNSNGKDRSVHRCASFRYTASNHSGHWAVSDCKKKIPYICKSKDTPFEWSIVEAPDLQRDYYTSAESAACPENYQFGIPETPLQQYSLEKFLADNNSPNTELWMDLNSLTVENCWVTGGPNSACPYIVSSSREFMIMVSCAGIFFVLLLTGIIMLDLIRIPIQDNRRSWKRVMNNYAKSETEGVPS